MTWTGRRIILAFLIVATLIFAWGRVADNIRYNNMKGGCTTCSVNTNGRDK